jgi:hypothetical protein
VAHTFFLWGYPLLNPKKKWSGCGSTSGTTREGTRWSRGASRLSNARTRSSQKPRVRSRAGCCARSCRTARSCADTTRAWGTADHNRARQLKRATKYDEAVNQLMPLRQRFADAYGPDDPRTLSVVRDLIVSYSALGPFAISIHIARHLVTTRASMLGADPQLREFYICL